MFVLDFTVQKTPLTQTSIVLTCLVLATRSVPSCVLPVTDVAIEYEIERRQASQYAP